MLLAMKPPHSTAAEPTEPTPDPSSTVTRSGSTPEDDERYDIWTMADEQSALENAERLIGGLGGDDRERALVEAGRLYGRDHARARAALEDGTHPLCRLRTLAR
jgi:hypothetical protein